MPVTDGAVYRAGGSAAESVVYTVADAPDAPGASAPQAGKGGSRRWALVAAAGLLVLALFGGGTVYGLPLLMHAGSTAPSSQTAVLAATGATVTITPARSDLKNAFPITGVTGAPEASKSQVQARQLSVTTSAQSKTVNATGSQTISGIQSTGTLSLDIAYIAVNGSYIIAAGTTFIGASGVTVATNSAVDLNTGATTIMVPSHAVNPGANGNIPTLDINVSVQQGCLSVCAVKYTVKNPTAFTGGKDASTSSVVQQSDIDNASNNLIQANQPNAEQVLQGRLQQGEQLIGTPQCSPNVSADHQAGDQASQVTVTVSFTCTGEAYDQAGALVLAQQLLTSQAATTPGAGYALAGQIKTALVSASPDNQGGVAIVVQAEGIWVYQFSDSQKQALASLIAGKSQQEAMSLLTTQTGVAEVRIQIQGGTGQALPTDAQKITVVIQPMSGL
jgi:VCBS repeat-containing protein